MKVFQKEKAMHHKKKNDKDSEESREDVDVPVFPCHCAMVIDLPDLMAVVGIEPTSPIPPIL